jgi:phosphomethylpyrimidine synthase
VLSLDLPMSRTPAQLSLHTTTTPPCCAVPCCITQVPFRRVHLTNGNHFDLYDTSGPQVGSMQALKHLVN